MNHAFTIGADPEVFIKIDGQISSAIGRIPGTKEAPHQVPLGAIQCDNVLAEFNIEPAQDAATFKRNIKGVLAQLTAMYELAIIPSYTYTDAQIKSFGKEALVFGCDPDFNCYTGLPNPKPAAGTLRTAGGHVHVGGNFENKLAVVAAMDIALGLPSVLVDKDGLRRAMYGKAGCYRDKPYGVEYRTLSNFWLKSDELIDWVYEATNEAVQRHEEWLPLMIANAEHTQSYINYPREEAVRQMLRKFNVKTMIPGVAKW